MAHSQAEAEQLEKRVRMKIESLSYLTTTVAVAMKFVELGKNPDAEPNEYSKVISSDASLSTKLLALANSSWFGVRNHVTRPQMAVNLLGLGTVRTLAISYCLTGLNNELKLKPEESRLFWTASLFKAVVAREVAKLGEANLGEEAFTAALFQDFALPVMYSVSPQQTLDLLNDRTLNSTTRLARERQVFRLDHTELARLVAEKLELPDVFVDAVAFHHNAESLKEFIEKPAMADALTAAALFPHLLEAWSADDAEALRKLLAGMPKPVVLEELLQTVQNEFNQLYRFFEDGEPPEMRLAEVLESASKEAADHTTRLVGSMQEMLKQNVAAGKQVHQLLQVQGSLEEAANNDPLTGALNREGFSGRSAELLAKATRYGLTFGVAYIDVDKFKLANDTAGHRTGDAVLKTVVESIRSKLKSSDAVARLGGDEFVILFGDCNPADAEKLIGTVLQEIAGQKFPRFNDKITLSCGFVWFKPKETAMTVEQVVGAADQLMYQAKRKGGNACNASPATAAPASGDAPQQRKAG